MVENCWSLLRVNSWKLLLLFLPLFEMIISHLPLFSQASNTYCNILTADGLTSHFIKKIQVISIHQLPTPRLPTYSYLCPDILPFHVRLQVMHFCSYPVLLPIPSQLLILKSMAPAIPPQCFIKISLFTWSFQSGYKQSVISLILEKQNPKPIPL